MVLVQIEDVPRDDSIGAEVNEGAVIVDVPQDGVVAGGAHAQAPLGNIRRSQRTTHLSTKLRVSTSFVMCSSFQDAIACMHQD